MPNLTDEQEVNVRLWVAALRSGEFRQGRLRLRNKQGAFCCLGVACEVFRRSTGEGAWNPNLSFNVGAEVRGDDLPQAVMGWLGVSQREPRVEGNTASWLNDQAGETFPHIADAIEREYLTDGVRS